MIQRCTTLTLAMAAFSLFFYGCTETPNTTETKQQSSQFLESSLPQLIAPRIGTSSSGWSVGTDIAEVRSELFNPNAHDSSGIVVFVKGFQGFETELPSDYRLKPGDTVYALAEPYDSSQYQSSPLTLMQVIE